MRLIRTLVPASEVSDVRATLDEHNIDYVVFREDSGRDDAVLVEFPLPTQAVESVLDELREETAVDGEYTIVTGAQSVFSENFDEMEDRFITGSEEDDSIATEEIRATALDLTPNAVTYYSMTVLSALVATAGLLLDSPAIVVGSMVIAPLVGSALTASVGTVLLNRDMILDGFQTQVYGLVIAILGATLFSLGLKSASFLPATLDVTTTQQISQRISPGLLSVTVGLSAGAAGAFGLATGVSVTLVGVMVAAALIPAAAAVGIGLAWGVPAVALGAFVMLVLNVVSIHVSGVTVLWYLGYRPEDWSDGDGLVAGLPGIERQRLVPLVAVTVALVGVSVVAGVVVTNHIAFEQDVNRAVGETLSEEQYDDLELVVVRSEFDGRPLYSLEDQQVTVVIGRTADRPYPELSRTLTRRIEDATGREVTVVVEFVEQQGGDDGRSRKPRTKHTR